MNTELQVEIHQEKKDEFGMAEAKTDGDVIKPRACDDQPLSSTAEQEPSEDASQLLRQASPSRSTDLEDKATTDCVLNADLDQKPDGGSISPTINADTSCCPAVSTKR